MNNLATVNRSKERQTPIETALQIDADGNTTSKALYSFLEWDRRNYAKWVKVNIIDNPYAEESADYWVYVPKEENHRGGRPTVNYKLTATFAKKLTMTSDSPKGEETRNYFVQVEQNAKKFANSYQMQDELEMMVLTAQRVLEQKKLSQEHEVRIKAIEQTATNLQETIETVKNVFVEPEKNWREMIHKNIDKIVAATGENHYNIWSMSYKELDRHGFNVKRRLENRRKRMAEFGFSKTDRNKIGKLDIIEADPKTKEIYTGIVREMVLKFVV
jgi:anti-repressor protein